MYEIYLDIRDTIVNRLICFLLKHCDLHAGTIRAFVEKIDYSELAIMNEERKHS